MCFGFWKVSVSTAIKCFLKNGLIIRIFLCQQIKWTICGFENLTVFRFLGKPPLPEALEGEGKGVIKKNGIKQGITLILSLR